MPAIIRAATSATQVRLGKSMEFTEGFLGYSERGFKKSAVYKMCGFFYKPLEESWMENYGKIM